MLAVFDCFSGISGDMALGALVEAIGDGNWLTSMVHRLGMAECGVAMSVVRRGPLAATRVEVRTPERDPLHRTLSDLRDLLSRCGLPPRAAARADCVLRALVTAESVVHGSDPEATHLHEAGGLDAVVDIAGTCLGLELLGVDEVYATPVPLGSGVVRCEHGLLPVPAPAVAELLRGIPVQGGREGDGEAVTPTGAALLVGLGASWLTLPTVTLERVGYGAGSRATGVRGLPNVLRVLICAPTAVGETWLPDAVMVIDAAVDDMTPELLESGIESIVAAGALEVLRKSVVMGRGRSGWEITVIAPLHRRDAVLAALFTSTSTIGVRERVSGRVTLAREEAVVSTPYGEVRVKLASFKGAVVNVKPEHRDCVQLAAEHGLDVKRVAAAATAAAAGFYSSRSDVPRGTSFVDSSGANS